MADLGTNVRYIKGIGEVRANALEKLGIVTLGDLISYFPRGYEDRTAVRPIRELTAGECVCVRGMVAADPTPRRIAGGRTLVKTRVVDEVFIHLPDYSKESIEELVHGSGFFQRPASGQFPAHGGDVCVFRQGGGRSAAQADDQPPVRAGGAAAGHRTHYAHLSPDRRSDPGAYGPGSPAGAGRLPGAAAGRAARRHPPGPQPVLCELRL